MHTVDVDSEQGQRVRMVIEEVTDVYQEFLERGLPAQDVISGVMGALALGISSYAEHDDMAVLDYADQVKAVIIDVNTALSYYWKHGGEPAND